MHTGETERRVTCTHEGLERRGALRLGGFELEGDSYLYLVAGALVSLLAWVVLQRTGMPFLPRAAAACLPLAGAVFWLKLMILGKPPAHQSDVMEELIQGRDFWTGPGAFDAGKPPLAAVAADVAVTHSVKGDIA
jgi:hypothetical protein